MTEMTDVNIKLSINTSSLLPSKLEYSMPEKDISKDDSNKYVSVYFDEYRSLHKIFESELEDKKEIKLLQEDIYMNYLPKVGTCDKSLKLFISALIDLLPFGLFNCNFKSEMVSLANVLGKSTWNYILSTTSTVLPLFVTTVYNMFTPQDFQYQSCNQVTYGTVQVIPSSFNQTCGSIPINWYTKDFPSHPALSASGTDTVCTGIASQISSKTYVDYALLSQYVIYAILILMAATLSKLEYQEKILTRISIGLRGVFISCDDSRRLLPTNSFFKRYGTIIVILLACGYVASISIFPQHTEDWYIFPTLAAELAYLNANEPAHAGETLHGNWCNLLTVPIKVTYVKYSSSSFPAALLQAVLFLTSCYTLITSQSKLYDWMDCDQYMDASNKNECSYYDIQNYRNRVFSEPMLYDWIAVNLYYPIFYKVLHDPVYSSIHDKLSKKTVEIIDNSLKSMHTKYSTKSSKNGRIE